VRSARGEPDALLCITETGHQLHATALKRTLGWTKIAEGRRIRDLRHTAACLWLVRGVDPATVQAWMGHASIATTNLYLHHLGTASDRAGLTRLNQAPGCTRGAQDDRTAESQECEDSEDPASDLVRRISTSVELRGLEPLTFSLRRWRQAQVPGLMSVISGAFCAF
jgi:hypothetical protein